jgi:hypothetical protein
MYKFVCSKRQRMVNNRYILYGIKSSIPRLDIRISKGVVLCRAYP